MKLIIIASQNEKKAKEVKEIISDLNAKIITSTQAGVFGQAKENAGTCEENALLKAKYAAAKTGEWALGDDTGFFIKALNGRPGVHAKRWAGENPSDQDIINITLNELKKAEKKERSAYFKSAVALVSPAGKSWIFSAKLNGRIAAAPRGNPRPGLPYDMLFIPNGYKKTFAEMTDEQKNSISHRFQALKKLKKFYLKKKLFSSD